MSRFWDDALQVLENAACAHSAGGRSDVAVLIDHAGGLRIVAAEGWSPEGLESHYGASAVYRVSHGAAGVCVEGRGAGVSCTLRHQDAIAPSLRLPLGVPMYPVETRKLLA
jgi:hypothetical protein